MAEQSYGGIDRTTKQWWRSPSRESREYTDEELELLRRKFREAEAALMKALLERG